MSEDNLSQSELYDKYELSWVGRIFVTHALPHLNKKLEPREDYDTNREDEIMAEIAVWRAFNAAPIFRPYLILIALIAVYDYSYPMPVEIYAVLIVGLASLNGIITNLRSKTLLAAEYADLSDERGIPASLTLSATNAVNSSINLVFVACGLIIQLIISAEVVNSEILTQDVLTNTGIDPMMMILGESVLLYLLGKFRS